jgi:Protein of unknown function (DUF2934)
MSDLHRSTPKQDVPTRDQVAQRAYELYERRGSEPGRDVEDWLTAETELRSQNLPSASSTSTSNDQSRSSLPTSRQKQSKTRTTSPSSFETPNPVDHQNSTF